ncbi:MAG: AraC family transcriptional regulator ligand-binding domain-containing protein [Pseudomonadota bacterium]|nr:AraC family transcriptional regulator ligand-binding domain-containing protein [Pseudomonadota bacterium]
MTEPTVTLRFTQGLLQAAERRGIELPPALSRRVPETGRTPLAVQDQLWQAYCDAVDDPLVGLQLGLGLQVGHLDLVGMLLMSCETLGEALDLLLEYHPIVGEGGDFALRHAGGNCLLIYQPHYQTCRRQRVEAVLACVLNLARWVSGGEFAVRCLQFTSAAAAPMADYQRMLGASLQFDAPEDALVFDPALVATPLIQANTEIRDQLKKLADKLLQDMERGEYSMAVQRMLRQQPQWGKERVAEALGMSGRHLVRKLQHEGVTFKLLRSSLLQKMAEERLQRGEQVSGIAEELGFSDESAFAKAFKRWSGQTPSQYREQ